MGLEASVVTNAGSPINARGKFYDKSVALACYKKFASRLCAINRPYMFCVNCLVSKSFSSLHCYCTTYSERENL